MVTVVQGSLQLWLLHETKVDMALAHALDADPRQLAAQAASLHAHLATHAT
jgi:hypothetical protein